MITDTIVQVLNYGMLAAVVIFTIVVLIMLIRYVWNMLKGKNNDESNNSFGGES